MSRKPDRPRGKVDRPLAKLRTADEKDGGYPSIGDQLDALWKIADVLMKDATPGAITLIDTAALDVKRRIDAVKTKFPKKPR